MKEKKMPKMWEKWLSCILNRKPLNISEKSVDVLELNEMHVIAKKI